MQKNLGEILFMALASQVRAVENFTNLKSVIYKNLTVKHQSYYYHDSHFYSKVLLRKEGKVSKICKRKYKILMKTYILVLEKDSKESLYDTRIIKVITILLGSQSTFKDKMHL